VPNLTGGIRVINDCDLIPSNGNKGYSTPEQALDSYSAASCGVFTRIRNKIEKELYRNLHFF
jgi:hypothetical protein